MADQLSWNQIVEQYPDKWVALENCIMDNASIVSASIVKVLTDDEIDDYEDKNYMKHYKFRRTTEGTNVGVCHVENIRTELRPKL